MLRSKSPDLALQEIWGHLCCHYAIRSLMADAAIHAGHDPDRVSFVAALRITRTTIAHAGRFSPLTSTTATTPLDDLPPPTHRPTQPSPTTPLRTPRDQTQDAEMARQTRPPRPWPQPDDPPRYHHPPTLT